MQCMCASDKVAADAREGRLESIGPSGDPATALSLSSLDLLAVVLPADEYRKLWIECAEANGHELDPDVATQPLEPEEMFEL